jgi:hypothetical protein
VGLRDRLPYTTSGPSYAGILVLVDFAEVVVFASREAADSSGVSAVIRTHSSRRVRRSMGELDA